MPLISHAISHDQRELTAISTALSDGA
eukprot:COSAG04_NODE_27899_length_279_cov_0.577778_1_plen_26_part_01